MPPERTGAALVLPNVRHLVLEPSDVSPVAAFREVLADGHVRREMHGVIRRVRRVPGHVVRNSVGVRLQRGKLRKRCINFARREWPSTGNRRLAGRMSNLIKEVSV